MDKTYKHDIESYVITIRRKGVVSSAAPVEEVLKPAQPVHKIEKPVREPSVMPVPVPEVSSVAFRTPLTDEQEMLLYRYFKSVDRL